jgi:DNA-binding response OmpR family regulator
MERAAEKILVVAGAPWFAARLGVLLAPAGYAIARADSPAAARPVLRRSPPAAIVLSVPPRVDDHAEAVVATLRSAGYAGPVVVLDRTRKIEGRTRYLSRAASPARVATELRRLVAAT